MELLKCTGFVIITFIIGTPLTILLFKYVEFLMELMGVSL